MSNEISDKLKHLSREDVWNEYFVAFRFVDDEFVDSKSSMEEQIALWSRSPLGKKILKGSTPKNIKEFRGLVPLTSYDDYASELLLKRKGILYQMNRFYGSRQLGRVVNIPSRWLLILKVCWIHLNEMSVPVCYWELQQSEGFVPVDET